MARPALSIDEIQLRSILRMKPSLADTAAFFSCSEDTIERHIRRSFKCSFAEFREQNMVHTRFSLIRTALQKAENGDNVMLIFALKNLCGWQNQAEPPVVKEPEKVLELRYSCGCTSTDKNAHRATC